VSPETQQLLSEIPKVLELDGKATKGDWTQHQTHGQKIGIRAKGEVVAGFVAFVSTNWPHLDQVKEQQHNADLIAFYRNITPSLAREYMKLREGIECAKEALELCAALPVAAGYPDGPCLEYDDHNQVSEALQRITDLLK
jgi:hypothetical protein